MNNVNQNRAKSSFTTKREKQKENALELRKTHFNLGNDSI